jgi:hypothetical protein
MHAKISYTSFKNFSFIHALFSISQSSQYVSNDVRPMLQGVGVGFGHSIGWQEEGFSNSR